MNTTKGPSQILHNLFIGGERDIDTLIQNHINIIIDLRNASPRNIKVPEDVLMEYITIPMYDGVETYHQFNAKEKLFRGLEALIRLLQTDTNKVAVICHEGVSRSATLITLYLMSTGLTLEEALTFMTSKRKQIAPHPEFYDLLENVSF